MALIVNLSSVHTLDLSRGFAAFTKLCDLYSQPGCCLSVCGPGFFSHNANKVWVAYQYQMMLSHLINPYKRGEKTTQEFLNGLLGVFSFLNDATLSFPAGVVQDIASRRGEFLSLKGTGNTLLSKKQIALALLEDSWNAILDFSDNDIAKLQHLIECAKQQPVYLMSNTNELNIYRLLTLIAKQVPSIATDLPNIISKITVAKDNKPIQLAPNIYLCLSYRFQLFKTPSQNKTFTTDSLLKQLVTYLGEQKHSLSTIQVISQYPKDLIAAKEVGIPPDNCHTSENFYPVVPTVPLEVLAHR